MTPRLRPLLALLAAAGPAAALAQSAEDGRDVYGPCAACHGANGEGGKGGEYPRLAGQPASFIVASLQQFQARKRHNLPMFPYMEPRELSPQDMKDVAAWLTAIVLPSKAPEFKETDGALDRLLAMEKVLVVPRVEGDVGKGQATYRRKCGSCHGKGARGNAKKAVPALVGQYPAYLQRQVDAYRKGERGADESDPMNGVLTGLSPQEVTDVLAWLTSIQDQEPEPEAAGAGGPGAAKAP